MTTMMFGRQLQPHRRRQHSLSVSTILTVLLLLCCQQSVISDDSSQNVFTGNPQSAIPPDLTVGAFYYPWHKAHFDQKIGYMRTEMTPRHEIRLGEYDDTRPEVIQQHLDWSRQANIKVWVASWWGYRSPEDRTLREVILPHKDLQDHKISFFYETAGRVKERDNFNMDNVVKDMQYICQEQKYFDHPNYFRINGKPVLTVYLTRLFYHRGVLDKLVSTMRNNCDVDFYLLGDQVWGKAPANAETYSAFDLLDGVTNYDIYGNIGRPRYAGQELLDRHFANAAQWKLQAEKRGVGFIPSISPGYNDRGVRLQSDNAALSRKLHETSEHGTLFAAQLEQAPMLTDPKAANFMIVNSFNEWHEDTQIEPCDGKPSTEPEILTQGLEYRGYGELYLNMLRAYTCLPATCPPIQAPLPVQFMSDPPAIANVAAFYKPWLPVDYYRNSQFHRNALQPQQATPIAVFDDENSQSGTDLIRQHLEYSRQAGISLWITPWISPGHGTDRSVLNGVLQSKYLFNHRVALFYEIHTRITQSDNWSTVRVEADVAYICDNYFDPSNNNYYRVGGRPVLFLSLTRVHDRRGILEDLTLAIRNVATSKGYDMYLIGDHVWGPAPAEGNDKALQLLDGIMNRDVYGDLGAKGSAGTDAVDAYYEKQRQWRLAAWRNECSYLPSVTPGFNNRAVGGTLDALSRRLNAGDEEGSLFEYSLDKAKYLLDSETDDLIIVNSLNGFDEDTQLLPVFGEDTNLPVDITQDITYGAYGDMYLDALAQRFGTYSGLTSEPTQLPTTHPTRSPTNSPTHSPTSGPTSGPTRAPTSTPTNSPTKAQTGMPTSGPTSGPTRSPTSAPTTNPTSGPTRSPTSRPTSGPTSRPTSGPTAEPTAAPTKTITGSRNLSFPSAAPSVAPSETLSEAPSSMPSETPTSGCVDDASWIRTRNGITLDCAWVERRPFRRCRRRGLDSRRAYDACCICQGISV